MPIYAPVSFWWMRRARDEEASRFFVLARGERECFGSADER